MRGIFLLKIPSEFYNPKSFKKMYSKLKIWKVFLNFRIQKVFLFYIVEGVNRKKFIFRL